MKQNKIDFEKIVQDLDEKVKSGRSREVREALSELKLKTIPKNFRSPLAQIARRSGHVFLALKIMNPVVNPQKILEQDEIRSEDIITYSGALVRIGSTDEALKRLATINETDFPETTLIKAFGHILIWNYGEAAKLLRRYIKSNKVSDYQRAVGKVNLIAALVATDKFIEAEQEITEILMN